MQGLISTFRLTPAGGLTNQAGRETSFHDGVIVVPRAASHGEIAAKPEDALRGRFP